MIETIAGAFKEVAGPLAKTLGGAAAKRIEGGSQVSRAQCSKCGGVFPANPSLPTLQCPLCGTQLTNQRQEQPQPEPEPQAQSQVTESQQVAKSTSEPEPQQNQ